MSAKPTPGPYKVEPGYYGAKVTSGGVTVGRFEYRKRKGKYVIDHDQAEANARAWVDGIAALEKLARIEQAMRTVELDNHEVVAEIRHILRAKP